MKHTHRSESAGAIGLALGAAALYAANIPLSKLLLESTGAVMLAALLYLGAGLGMGLWQLVRPEKQAEPFTKKHLPYILGMILLDIAAPICLMLGLQSARAENVSLLNNFEIAATALIALLLFREQVSPRMWGAIALITLSCGLLSFEGRESLRFSGGSVLVLTACLCWGLENNCTRALSGGSARMVVILKGIFSGTGSLIVALLSHEVFPSPAITAAALALGFVSYGMSILFYVRAQRTLGAARTSAYYAVNPFIGSALALLLFREPLGERYWPALAIMLAGTALAVADSLRER